MGGQGCGPLIPLTNERYGRLFWVAIVVGWAAIGFGIWGVFHTRADSVPVSFAGWMAGAAIVHDFLVAPVVFAAGIALRHSLGTRIRTAVQAALIVSGVVLSYSFPLLLGYGRRPTNPTVQPNNYAIGVVGVLAFVWTVAFAWMAVASRRARNR